MKPITPVSELGASRWPRAGKIRLGDRGGKNRAPRALTRFRITSPDEQIIREVADLYGGTAKPWSDKSANPPDQWEVQTEATELRVFLPPGALDCGYEFWSGGGRVRRCDGIECEVAGQNEMMTIPCPCKAAGVMSCKPHTRLSVVLPEVRFAGVFELTSTGWHAAAEMASMQTLIEQLQTGGRVIDALLVLEQAQAQGGSRKFVVPKLRLSASVLALVAGEASVGALHSGHGGMAELGTGTLPEPPGAAEGPIVGIREQAQEWFDADDEVIDAVLVDGPVEVRIPPREEGEESAEVAPPLPAAASPSRKSAKFQTKLVLSVKEASSTCGVDETLLRHALSRKASAGATSSSKELIPEAASQVIEWATEICNGATVEVLSEDPPKVRLGG